MTDVLVFLVIIVPMAIAVGRFAVILFGGAVPGEHISWVEFKLAARDQTRASQTSATPTRLVPVDKGWNRDG